MSVGQAGAVNVELILDGQHIPDEHHVSFVVDRDVNQPDMAAIVLKNQDHRYSKLKIAAPVEIKVGADKVTIYKGEITGLEPTFKAGEKARILIRGMNKLHRLSRIRKSKTYMDMSDKDIVTQVAQDAGLSLQWTSDKTIKYKHVYQHNQSDLEFVRMRAARMGCQIWCVDTTLYVKAPDLGNDSGIILKISQEVAEDQQLRSFTPRISSAPVVKKVTVKGWNPETKELITGEAEAQSSPLGSQNAVAASGDHGKEVTFTVDHPIWSKEEADALAKARLVDASLSYMTGEVETIGDPKFELGKTLKVVVNTEAKDDVFNGKYLAVGITHRYIAGGSSKDGFVSVVRLARDAQKGT